jgi:hypothetical protein
MVNGEWKEAGFLPFTIYHLPFTAFTSSFIVHRSSFIVKLKAA